MKRMIALCLACAAMPAWSGIYIYGTRIIYPAQKKDITVQLMNDGKRSSLIQAWIDNGDTSLPPEKLQVPFIMTPPVIRVAANSGQQLKIKKLANNLPGDRESLFYLNVLDIPPNSDENKDKNIIKFALQNRIKLIYRPPGVQKVDKATFSRLQLFRAPGSISVKNNSANWITIPEIKAKSKVNKETLLLAPWSSQSITTTVVVKSYTVTLIDDSGNYLNETVKIEN
ncbi:fimbrial assembly chaperone [Salmonella enterica]|uniref:Fimbrial assembly chaperone n=1 Tax=Salmonella enterica subsp. enterica serovar Ouakam TaxID=1243585 RepID=A0A5I8HS79_SALET|nr:fimbrial assembly chaperone [Salmonella enterica]EAC2032614.1 fimbrial assembly chaperone [Salmonella enterica subsp. enterica]EBW8617035.1 fimbrial assembly chaperone [Salmonella enterica subsp. enterica serovar Enteritidis]EDV2722993.1 fimbrial assembly chaperone [Salmonella enterica subsp. enterica serovar Johannesburg]EEJ2630112.1 fimbrial assembly chaperone [Salmonella enterica subsp. enterica serovar Anatum]KRT24318.1 fimbrial assembly protein [Salmonella enterica subsp. enterica sero